MRTLATIAIIIGLLISPTIAQSVTPAGSPQSGYLAVMSKAGTPVARPPVPVRNVALPAGAGAGYDYYYGQGYGRGYGYSGGSASPSYANESRPTSSGALPGYDTRPRSSSSDSSVYSSSKRRRR